MTNRSFLALFLSALMLASPASAQPAPDAMNAVDQAAAGAPATPAPAPDVPFTGSFVFTPLELSEVMRAKAGVVLQTPSSTATDANGQPVASTIPMVRRIILSGVYYRKPGDWTAWINGQKVTPDNLLPEIVGIKVDKDRVSLKWFDIGLNGVIAVTLRPRQIYDIVTGVVLPE